MSPRRRLDTPLTTDRWRDYRPKSASDWLGLAIMCAAAGAGIVVAIWATGGL
jgi:hypothetical protein